MTGAQDDETLGFYARSAAAYAARGPMGASRNLPEFLKLLRPGSRILELGCGAGRDSRAMIEAGHEVEPTDGVPEIAREAEALLKRPVRVMRFEDLDACEAYDAIWANAALLHAPRPALPQILAKIRRALKPGGLHHASYKGGGREGRDRHGRYFNYLSAEEVRRLYAASGRWEVLSVAEYLGGGYDPDEPTPWVAATLRRPFEDSKP